MLYSRLVVNSAKCQLGTLLSGQLTMETNPFRAIPIQSFHQVVYPSIRYSTAYPQPSSMVLGNQAIYSKPRTR